MPLGVAGMLFSDIQDAAITAVSQESFNYAM
jgi:hypothetical protein